MINRYKTLKEQVYNDKLNFLQQTLKNPLYINGTFSQPWYFISR